MISRQGLNQMKKRTKNDGRIDGCFTLNKSHTSWTKPSKPISPTRGLVLHYISTTVQNLIREHSTENQDVNLGYNLVKISAECIHQIKSSLRT